MRDFITSASIANQARMLRQASDEAAICIVEGGDDKLRFKPFFKEDCYFVIAEGWEKAVEALKEIEESNHQGIIAIIDADHRWITKDFYTSQNLFLSDFHDFEIDLVSTPAFDRLIEEMCDSTKLAHPPAAEIRKQVFEASTPLACLRLYSTINKLHLRFRGVSHSAFVDSTSLRVDYGSMVQEVKNKSQRLDIDSNKLIQGIKETEAHRYDPLLICRGHDFISILSLSLRKLFAKHSSSQDIAPKRLEQLLRIAYQWNLFVLSRLYNSLKAWQGRNNPFEILVSS